jgi:FMN phosphatase YigB (HAD superfamily)
MNKQKAIILDLDGTLYRTLDRVKYVTEKPKDYDKFHKESINDDVNKWCAQILEKFWVDHTAIFLTGRNERYREITEKWFKKNELGEYFDDDRLFMRDDKDFRKDYVSKKEIYLEEIKPKYDVTFAIDDRIGVYNMWREIDVPPLYCGKAIKDAS